MLSKAAAGIVLGLIAGSLILVGVSFAAFAIFTALVPPVGTAGAAALTAVILLIVPVFYVLFAALSADRRREASGEAALLNVFALLAKDKPLLAMVGAGLAGAAGIWLKKKR